MTQAGERSNLQFETSVGAEACEGEVTYLMNSTLEPSVNMLSAVMRRVRSLT